MKFRIGDLFYYCIGLIVILTFCSSVLQEGLAFIELGTSDFVKRFTLMIIFYYISLLVVMFVCFGRVKRKISAVIFLLIPYYLYAGIYTMRYVLVARNPNFSWPSFAELIRPFQYVDRLTFSYLYGVSNFLLSVMMFLGLLLWISRLLRKSSSSNQVTPSPNP